MRASAAGALAAGLLAAVPAAGDGVETAGDVLQVALPLAAAGMAVGLRDWEGAGSFTKAFASTMTTTFVLKVAVDAERPDGGGQSFPSGHAAAAFSGASFLGRRYGWRLGVPAVGAAAFVAWSRVHADRHHVEDVVAAAALAVACNFAFTRPLPPDVALLPLAGPGRVGLSVAGRW